MQSSEWVLDANQFTPADAIATPDSVIEAIPLRKRIIYQMFTEVMFFPGFLRAAEELLNHSISMPQMVRGELLAGEPPPTAEEILKALGRQTSAG